MPNVSVVPKFNGVFHHLWDFKWYKNMPLGLFSEQTVEATHQDFHHQWIKYKM